MKWINSYSGLNFADLDYKVKAYFRIAKIYERQNRLEEAKEIYRKITQLDVDEARIAEEKIEEIDKEYKNR